jgi:cholesterol transport system auxiliary component
MNRRRFLLALPVAALLPGCAVLSEPEAPIVYRLAPPAPAPREARPVGLQVTLGPSPAMVDSQRIGLSRTAEKVDVYANALWADRLPILVEQAVTAALRASGGYARVSDAGTERGDWLLRLTVPLFEARYDGAGTDTAPTIVVAVQALLRNPARTAPIERTFQSELRASGPRLDAIVSAFNRAFAEVQTALLDFVHAATGDNALAQR